MRKGAVCLLISVLCLEVTLRVLPVGGANTDLEKRHFEGSYFESPHFQYWSELGYGAIPSEARQARYHYDGELIYDATYTIAEDGFRLTPSNSEAGLSFVFLGCGMTFGEGLDDHETLPAYFSQSLDFQYHVINASVNGYGPHHALRIIESGLMESLAKRPIASVYYETTPSHMLRTYTPPDWALTGPDYVLGPDGKSIHYAGARHSLEVARLTLFMSEHSKLFHLVRSWYQKYRQQSKEVILWHYLQILKHSRDFVEKQLNAEYQVLLWDTPYIIDGQNLTPAIIDFLEREAIDYSLVSEIFGTDDISAYVIPYDGHPNARANQILGQYLADDWNETL